MYVSELLHDTSSCVASELLTCPRSSSRLYFPAIKHTETLTVQERSGPLCVPGVSNEAQQLLLDAVSVHRTISHLSKMLNIGRLKPVAMLRNICMFLACWPHNLDDPVPRARFSMARATHRV